MKSIFVFFWSLNLDSFSLCLACPRNLMTGAAGILCNVLMFGYRSLVFVLCNDIFWLMSRQEGLFSFLDPVLRGS